MDYLFTNFTITKDPLFDVINPKVGIYTISYESTDMNNVKTDLSINIDVKDTKPPIITFQTNDIIYVDQFEELIIPTAFFTDIGSRLSKIEIDLSNTYNTITTDICLVNLINNDISNYTFLTSQLLLNTNDTSNSTISYELVYKAFDIHDNDSIKYLTIGINHISNFVFTPILNINTSSQTYQLILDRNFNQNFNQLINNDIYLKTIFNTNDIQYNNFTKIITYEINTLEAYNLLSFTFNVRHFNHVIPDTDNFISDNRIGNIISNNEITFITNYIPDGVFEDGNILKIYFNVVDTTPPILSFISSTDFPNLYNIKLPLLPNTSIAKLETDINFFVNYNLQNPYLFTKDSTGNIMYSIPGINITDVLGGSTISLSNETLPSAFDTSLSLFVNYTETIPSLGFDISSRYIIQHPGNYIQNYKTYDYTGNFSDISRIIQVQNLVPFIRLNYPKDICDNVFLKTYHKQFVPYYETYGKLIFYNIPVGATGIKDYSLNLVNNYDNTNDSQLQLKLQNLININTLGIQQQILNIDYQEINTKTGLNLTTDISVARQVHIINTRCLPFDSSGLNSIKLDDNNTKFNLDILTYDKYTIKIEEDNPIRLLSSINKYENNISYNPDISNLIHLSSPNEIIYNNNKYYYGNVDISVNYDFNRASIEYLKRDTNNPNNYLVDGILEDIFLYDENNECEFLLIDQLLNKPLPLNTFKVDVSGYNRHGYNTADNSGQFFTLTGQLYPSKQDSNRKFITDLSKATLHLPLGKYRFIQNEPSNFYNQIKFSITEDGTHNGGIEYTKNVIQYGLPGLSGDNPTSGYTEIILSIGTPSPLYYYSQNFPNMGGKIETRNNIVITNNDVNLTDNFLSIDNSSVLQNFNTQEILLNKIFLVQKFDLSNHNIGIGKDISKNHVNFNCLTQQNIYHNMFIKKDTTSNLIIFKKYQHSPNYNPLFVDGINNIPQYSSQNGGNISTNKIKHDISNHYLFDLSLDMLNTLILQYDYKIDTRDNLLKFSQENDMNYIFNILDLFYNNREIDNLGNFFRKNSLYSSGSTTNLREEYFKSKINELDYTNLVSIIENDTRLDYYLDRYLNSNRIKFSHIFDNKIIFNLQTYIDIQKIRRDNIIDLQTLNILQNQIFPLNFNGSNYLIDNSNLLFNEYVVCILSDIPGSGDKIVKTREESILFSNGLIEFAEYLMDSQDSSGILYEIYRNEINDEGLDEVKNELKNKVFLSLRDKSMTHHDYNQYIGITSQNIFHNMYIDENNLLIFHPYEISYNHFQVNTPNLTLQHTLSDTSNNKHYLLELSTNDIYGCFVDTGLVLQNNNNIYNNANTKNQILRQDASKYKSFIAYLFQNELPINHPLLNQFNIIPTGLNDISYDLYPYTYTQSLKQNHSYTYLIDLNDYFDRYIYDNSNIDVPWNSYDKRYLSYSLIDISYIHNFNLFDVQANQNIIYDKEKNTCS